MGNQRDALEEILEDLTDGLAFLCKVKDRLAAAIDQLPGQPEEINNLQKLFTPGYFNRVDAYKKLHVHDDGSVQRYAQDH